MSGKSSDLSPPDTRTAHGLIRWDLARPMELMRQERFTDALQSLQALPQEALLDPDTQLLHAILLTNAGRLKDAEQVCHQLLNLDELNAGAHYIMALCHEYPGNRHSSID